MVILQKMWRAATSWSVAFGVMLLVAIKAAAVFWPASYYLTVNRLWVPSQQPAGAEIELAWDRTIHRPFVGEWSLRVMKRSGAYFYNFCEASGEGPYQAGTSGPQVATIGWFSGGRCPTLPPGDYQILIALEARGWPFPATLHAQSNTFTVRPN